MCENLCLTVVPHSEVVFIQNSEDYNMSTLYFFHHAMVLKTAFFLTFCFFKLVTAAVWTFGPPK